MPDEAVPSNSRSGMLDSMLQQDPHLQGLADDPNIQQLQGDSPKQSSVQSSEQATESRSGEAIGDGGSGQRPLRRLPQAGPRGNSDRGSDGQRVGQPSTDTTIRTENEADPQSHVVRDGGPTLQREQPDSRQFKRKASHEPEDEEEPEGDSTVRTTTAPKRVKLQEPPLPRDPQPIPSTPSRPASSARTVLEKGFNNAVQFLQNLGSSGSTTPLNTPPAKGIGSTTPLNTPPAKGIGSTTPLNTPPAKSIGSTTPLSTPPAKGSAMSVALITPPPTKARPTIQSRVTRMLQVESAPVAESSSVTSKAVQQGTQISPAEGPVSQDRATASRPITEDMGGPSGTQQPPPLSPSPGPVAPSASEPSRMSRSVSSDSSATNIRERVDKGKARVPNTPPSAPSNDSGDVPNSVLAQLQADIRSLGTSVRGLGTAMVTLVDQNKTFTSSMDRFSQVVDKLASGGGINAGRPRRAGPSARDADAMEVDEQAGDDADDESEPLPVKLPRRKKPFKLTSLPVRRSLEENALKAAIRQMTLDYMGRKTNKSPFDMNRLPLDDELEDFEEAEEPGPCCTIDNFRPNLNGTARDKWNASVAEVFVEAYMEEGSVPCDDTALVEKYFVRHLKYLITKFKEQNTDQDVLVARAKAKRRRERRAYLFNRRLIAANSEPDLQRHVYILQRLGREGMSSDESDFSNGVKQFRILKKVWREPKLTAWLRVFDSIAREKRINPVTETTRGADPRQRFESGKFDDSSPPVGQLPWNAYNQSWYKDLTAYAKKRLEARKKTYDFSHTPDIEIQANQVNGSHVEGRAARFR